MYILLKLVLFSNVIFLIGVIGFLYVHLNILLWLLSIEIMAFAVNLNFLWVSIFYDDILGQLYVLIFLILIAAESAFAFILLVTIFQLNKTTDLNLIYGLKL